MFHIFGAREFLISSESEDENTLPKAKIWRLRLYKGYLSIHYNEEGVTYAQD
jgi:hypothetical protein